IPYGHPSIFTSAFLNMVACVVYKPLGLLICIICEIGIATKCLSAHRQKHHDVPALTVEQISVLEAYKLHESDIFEDWDNSSSVIPGIPYQEGYMCTFQGCYFATISKQRIQAHDRDSHHTRNNWKSCTVQALYASMQIKYPVVVPHSPPAQHVAPSGSQDLLAQVESFYEQHRVLHKGRLGPPMDRAHLNPFLAKYNWLEVIKDELPSNIIDWVKMPEKDESELTGILPCFQRYFDAIIKLLTDENAFRKVRILRAVNTTKSIHDLNNRPFKAPLRKQTVQRYVRTFAKMIAFVSRARDGQLDRASSSIARKVALASKIQCCIERFLTDMDKRQAAHAASHDLVMALLTTQYPPSTLFECPVKLFLIFSCVKLSGQILDPIHINPFLSELRWCLRAAGFYQICLLFENAPALVMENNPQALIEEVHRWLREDCMNIFGDLLEIGHFLSFVTANTSLLPRMMWADLEGSALSFDGRLIPIANVVNLYRILMEETKVQLYEVVLLGASLPNIDHEHIHDDLSNLEPGYSFLSDRRNRFWEHGSALMREMTSTFSGRFIVSRNSSGVVWNQGQVRRWMKDCEDCLQKLFLLYHLGSGQPARGTELAVMSWQNTTLHPRNVYWFSGYLNFVSRYNKTQTNQEKERVISRSMPPEAARLMIAYLTFVPKTLAMLALYLSLDGEDFRFSAGYENHLFNGLHGSWDSDDFSDILVAYTGRPVSEGGLGHPMGLADIRHLLIGVMRKNCRRLVADLDLEYYFDEQSGHQGEVARGYAVDHAYVQSVSSDHLQKFVALSCAHHALLFPLAAPAIPASPRVSSTVNAQQIDFDSFSRVISPYLSISMLPIIHRAIADGMAVCSPFSRPSSNTPLTTESHIGKVAKENLLCISPNRYRDLRALMGPQAMFQSREQAEAVEVLMRREVHAVIMLGLRENRSLFYLLPAVCPEEVGLISVVVLPQSEHIQEVKAQFEKKGLSAVIWSPELGNHGARAVLVGYDSLESTSFWTFLENAKGSLSRIIVGQAEYAFQSWEYQCAIANCERLQRLKLPIILLTYAMALTAVPKLLAYFKMDSIAAQLCRGRTDLRNICFSTFEAPLSNDLEGPLSACLNRSLQDLTTETELILVICPTEGEADRMATLFSKDVFHAHLAQDRKAVILQGWRTSRGDRRILFSSAALPLNLNDTHIRVLIHYREPSNFIYFADTLSLLRSDDRPSYNFIFFTPELRPKAWDGDEPEAQLMGAGDISRCLLTRVCRRFALSSFFGFEDSGCCLDITSCQICDVCE
ncbi:hypothetical protein F4604DRAFT_1515905, partial [Suillus subluteus]